MSEVQVCVVCKLRPVSYRAGLCRVCIKSLERIERSGESTEEVVIAWAANRALKFATERVRKEHSGAHGSDNCCPDILGARS